MPTTMAETPAVVLPTVVPGVVVMSLVVVMVAAAIYPGRAAIIGTRMTPILTKDRPPPARPPTALSVPAHPDALLLVSG